MIGDRIKLAGSDLVFEFAPGLCVPDLLIAKTVTSVDHPSHTGPIGTVDAAGDVINYQITVENTGEPGSELTNVTVSDPLIPGTGGSVLLDINADGTNSNASTTDFENAIGLPAGTLSCETVLDLNPGNNPADPYNDSASGVNVNVTVADAEDWLLQTNQLLVDGLFNPSSTTETITLSGSLGLAAKTSYFLHLFAGRSTDAGGNDTTFRFDVNNPGDPTNGVSIQTTPATPRTFPRWPIHRDRPALPTSWFSWSAFPICPIVAMQLMWTTRRRDLRPRTPRGDRSPRRASG